MRIIRFDSVGGASGDMILSSLIGLGVDPAYLEKELTSLIPGEFHIRTEQVFSQGIGGTRTVVEIPGSSDHHSRLNSDCHHHHHESEQDGCHDGHHHCGSHTEDHHTHCHRSYSDIRKMIEHSQLSETVKRDSIALFYALAEVEGGVHGKAPEDVHFHEVGAVDSIVDIVGAVIGFQSLGIDAVALSPIPVGYGTVHCAHGICPVPAPATAELAERFQLPVSFDGEECEMLTPTGALILGWYPRIGQSKIRTARILKVSNAIGGHLMKERPNLLRASLCEIPDISPHSSQDSLDGTEQKETLLRFDANLDDVSGEITAYAAEKLFKAGALDVWFTPIQMKKGRSASMISVLLPVSKREEFLELLFRETGTFGVREETVTRYALARRFEKVQTRGGEVSIKIGILKGEEIHYAPEYADCLLAAEKASQSLIETYRESLSEYQKRNGKDSAEKELEKTR